jgi:uridine monophosphate synthetase
MNFFEKLNTAIAKNQSLLIVGLDPNLEMMPKTQESEKNLISSLQTWLEFIITETSNLVCAYKPTLGFYQALGIPGLQLLTEIIQKIPGNIPIILDAKHSDINSSTVLARTIFEQWNIDAITISPYAGQDHAAPFLVYPDKAVFILCKTSNPSAVKLQEYPNLDAPLYLKIIEEAKTWGTPEQLCLEVGSISPETFTKVRQIAPERIILARSIWGENDNFKSILTAGLDKNGTGFLVPIPNDWFSQSNLSEKVQNLNTEINQIRNQILQNNSSCQLWTPDVCLLKKHPYQELILQLYDIGCLLFGEYVQASGATFSYYIDLRKIISNPQIFHQVLNAYADILRTLTFDRIAGIPYGSLPTATGLSLMLNHPMIFPRKEVKAHGTRRLIEGNFNPGEKVVVVDDILITGKSVVEGAEKIQFSGLNVEDIVVFIDHEEGVKDKLKAKGYQAYSVLTLSEITETLYASGRINEQQYKELIIDN